MSSAQKTTTTPTAASTTPADAAPAFQINQKKLKELAEQAGAIKIGGKVGRFVHENLLMTFDLGYRSS